MTGLTALSYDDLKHEFHLTNDGDSWGNCMNWWFSVAAEMYHRGLDIPSSWQYQPAMTDDPRELDDYAAQVCQDASDEALELFGNVLEKLSKKLKEQGKDY